MIGFYLTNCKNNLHISVPTDSRLNCTHITLDSWSIDRQTLHKFENHKFFIDEPSFFFSTDGVILNRDELLAKYHCTNFSELVDLLYKQLGETFFGCFRGSFSGVFYDKEKQLMLVFMDQTGTRLLFWEQVADDDIRISSDLCWLSAQKPDIQWDQLGLYELLTYGYMPSHHTIVDGIRRLPAGQYLRIENNSCKQLIYHRFTNKSIRRTQEEEIQGVDKLFRQAVQRVLKVNAEYNYSNIFPLSAGLDSRMANLVANRLTNRPIENFTYGFPTEEDVIVAQSIAKYLSHKWHFISQEGAHFYSNVDTCVRRSGMQVFYSGFAEATDSFSTIPENSIGIILTGIGGDDILASPLNRSTRHYNYGECALCNIQYPEQKPLIPQRFYTQYATRNIFYLYARTFECHAMGSPLAFQHYTESSSPYMDVDFLEFVFSIPEKRRKSYRLYDQWVQTCYPEATQWKHNGATISNRTPEVHIFHRHIPIGSIVKQIIWYILKRLHIHDFYYSELRKNYAAYAEPIWKKYFEENKHFLPNCGQIAECINSQYKTGNFQEKVQAMTVLASIKVIQETHAAYN